MEVTKFCSFFFSTLVGTNKCKFLAFATATKATKQQILHILRICEKDFQLIEQSTDGPNLFCGMSYLDKNDEIELAFSSLISEVKELNTETAGTLIYCQT